MFPRRPPTDEVVSIFDALVAKQGITTAPGAAGGTSIIDSGLIGSGANSFVNMGVVLYPGDPLHVDARSAATFNNVTGELTLDSAYKGVAAPIPAGVPYILVLELVAGSGGGIIADLNVPAPDAVANALERDVIGNKADTALQTLSVTASAMRYLKGLVTASGSKTAITPSRNSVNAAWQAAEQNLVTLGTAGVVNIIEQLTLGIAAVSGNITIRMYQNVNGVLTRFYPVPAGVTFNALTDAPGIPLIRGRMTIFGQLVVTCQSDVIGDNGLAITYEAN